MAIWPLSASLAELAASQRRLARWVTEAWRRRGRAARMLYATSTVEHLDRFRDLYEQWNMYMTDERPAGIPADELALALRLDEQLLDRKLTALRAMATQTRDLVASLDPAIYAEQVADECFADARTGENTRRLATTGLRRGES